MYIVKIEVNTELLALAIQKNIHDLLYENMCGCCGPPIYHSEAFPCEGGNRVPEVTIEEL